MANSLSHIRHCLIDCAIRTIHQPSKKDVIDFIRERSGIGFCESQIDKDIKYMRQYYDAPLVYQRNGCYPGYYKYTSDFEFWKVFLQYWDTYLDLPKSITELIYKEQKNGNNIR